MTGRKPIKHPRKENFIKLSPKKPKLETYSCASTSDTYRCKYCSFHTNFLIHLKNHLIIHTSRPKPKCRFLCYVCQKCDFPTHSILTLFKHVSDLCGSLKWFKCEQCTFKTHRNEYLIRHKKNKHTPEKDVRWFLCKLCSHRTRWKGNLKEHVKVKHLRKEPKLLKCAICDFETAYKQVLRKHKLKKHTYNTSPKWVKCDNCDYKTLRNDSLKRHVKSVHTADGNAKWFECGVCNFKSRRKDLLKRHIQQVHGAPRPILSSAKTELAPPKFSLSDLRIKYEVVPKTELQDLIPPMPPLGSYVKIQPRDPVLDVPPQERWFSCDQCPFSAMLQKSLKIHQLSHSKGNDKVVYFKCALCPLQTDRKDNLQRHIRETHMGWTPKDEALVTKEVFSVTKFCCDLCPFSTEWMNSLSVHKMLAH